LLRSTKEEQANLVHAAVKSFYDKIAQFKKEHPRAPTSQNDRGLVPLSLTNYHNDRMVKAIAMNCVKSSVLNELTICGMNLSPVGADYLNRGLLNASGLKKLRLNFCI